MNWAGPLLVLPGVGLLIMSTSARYIRLHDEVHHVAEHGEHGDFAQLLRRGRLFRNALVAAYLSVVFLALSGLVLGAAAAAESSSMAAHLAGTVLAVFGIAALVVSSGLLVLEATASYSVLEEHARALKVPHSKARKDGP